MSRKQHILTCNQRTFCPSGAAGHCSLGQRLSEPLYLNLTLHKLSQPPRSCAPCHDINNKETPQGIQFYKLFQRWICKLPLAFHKKWPPGTAILINIYEYISTNWIPLIFNACCAVTETFSLVCDLLTQVQICLTHTHLYLPGWMHLAVSAGCQSPNKHQHFVMATNGTETNQGFVMLVQSFLLVARWFIDKWDMSSKLSLIAVPKIRGTACNDLLKFCMNSIMWHNRAGKVKWHCRYPIQLSTFMLVSYFRL